MLTTQYTRIALPFLLSLTACGVHDNQSDVIEAAESPVQVKQELVQVAPSAVLSRSVAADHFRVSPNNERYSDATITGVFQTRSHPVSTFSSDVDTASYSVTRRYLSSGQMPPAQAIRPEEFINYFDYGLDKPSDPLQPIAINTELALTPWNPHTHLLRIGVQSYQTDFDNLPPLNLVFLLDVSGSMNSPEKLPLMQRSFNLLVEQLRPQDTVAIAVYAGASGVVLSPTPGDQKAQISQAIQSLQAGGSTHGSAGIDLAYQLAAQQFNPQAINRVIIGTDGDFNVGTTSLEALKSLIESKRKQGVTLSVLGFGSGNYNDALMEELSNHGDGVAYYIDTYNEARKIFSEQLTATLQTVAKDVKFQVEFNPNVVAEYRLIGYDNRHLNQEDFNNDNIDAGDLGSGHSVTAIYEVVLFSSEFRFHDPLRYQPEIINQPTTKPSELAYVKTRYKLPGSDRSQLLSRPIFARVPSTSSDAMQLASAVATFAELRRESPYVNGANVSEAINLLQPTVANDRWGYRAELLQLMKNAQVLVD